MSFSNTILGGETLVRSAMQSEGFESDVQGWRIERDGNAEFNDLSVRGRFESSDPTNGDVIIDDGEIVAIGDDTTATITQGGISVATNSIPDQSRMELGSNFLTMADEAGQVASLLIENGELDLTVDSGDGIRVANNGFLYHITIGGVLSAWKTITVNSGTAVAGNEPQVKLLPDGTVICRGVHTGHSVTANALIATLPVGHRPTRLQRFMAPCEGTGNENILYVETDGEIRVARAGSSSSWYSNLRFSTI